MVRHGIAMYGYSPGIRPVDGLDPVLEWYSQISSSKKVKKGEGISYGQLWRSGSAGWISTIPVGYADGVQRSLSNKGRVWVNGQTYTIRGAVTMDTIMIFSDRKLEPGTPVGLICGHNTAADWAKQALTIPYEILCGISVQRVVRQYI